MYVPYGKRVLDVVVASALIVLMSWLLLLILLAYWLTFSFPVFFRQTRLGKGEITFDLIKFRSLNADQKRPFALGSFLRYTSLDELPQLFQVVSGKLSLIGPRPLPVTYRNLYTAEQHRRHDVLPGITGWAQVNGRHSITWQRKFELDHYYVTHISLGMDFRIFIKTIALLMSMAKDRSLEEQEFKGN